MKLIGLMLVRNEDWVIEASLRGALRWCDEVAVFFDRCTDRTMEIVAEVAKPHHGRVLWMWDTSKVEHWEEMNVRQGMLNQGRAMGGTHFAIVDGDEILTANLLGAVRAHAEGMQPGDSLAVPMLAMRDLDHYQNDDSVWSGAFLSLLFADAADLTWRPAEDGYQHHHRLPYGIKNETRLFHSKSNGGCMHLQFANKRRLLAKHVLYRMVDHVRWPVRESVAELNFKYDQALQPPQKLAAVPQEWWEGHAKGKITLEGEPYQERLIRQLLAERGLEAFAGLDLKGF